MRKVLSRLAACERSEPASRLASAMPATLRLAAASRSASAIVNVARRSLILSRRAWPLARRVVYNTRQQTQDKNSCPRRDSRRRFFAGGAFKEGDRDEGRVPH